ncbi:hypothetical protein HYDPIDRAFT_35413 [Hydnomerulius pinastri MD-312]|nr:hypothetical protein HYDPIDRAFT_35413 [Hydnomerulius pinastri MD-312]
MSASSYPVAACLMSINHTNDALREPPGAVLIGGLLQCFFQGMILVQFVQYWELYPDDSLRRRLFVLFIVVLSVVQTALESHKVWEVDIDRQTLNQITGGWFALFLNNFICGVNKLFLLRRCWRITNRSRWIIVLFVLTVSTFAANLCITITAAQLRYRVLSPNQVLHQNEIALVAFVYWTSVSLVLDVILASILISFLWRNRTGMGHLDKALIRFFAITTEAATWPALCMAIVVGLYNADNPRSNRLTFLFLLITGKLYTLSLLRNLNARARLHERIQSSDMGRVSLQDWRWENATANYQAQEHVRNVPSMMQATVGSGRLSGAPVSPGGILVGGSAPASEHFPSVSSRYLESPLPIHSDTSEARTQLRSIRRMGSH